MKTHRYQRRFYQNWVNAEDLYVTDFVAKETDLQILTNKKLDASRMEEKVRTLRWDIEQYIHRDRRFLVSPKPVSVESDACEIVKEMSRQSALAGVGPMTTVAGAIAQFLGMDLVDSGFKDVIVENGGDIFLKTTKTRKIGIYAGKSKLWNKLKLEIRPKETPLGICTSSGTIGHSLGIGCADSVVIIAKNALLADAAATATGNRVHTRKDLQAAVDFARSIKGILGVVVILKSDLISWGGVRFVK